MHFQKGDANEAIFSPLYCKMFQDFIWGSWMRLFYFYIFGVTLKKKLLEKLQQTDPITLRIWGTLQKAIILPNLFLNCYAK